MNNYFIVFIFETKFWKKNIGNTFVELDERDLLVGKDIKNLEQAIKINNSFKNVTIINVQKL